jgi:hypothetical protein
MDSFKNIFDSAENKYSSTGSSLENFRFARDIYGFCVNEGNTDEQALNYARNINNNLCNIFLNQPKGLFGYNGHENKYIKIDDLDSKHIMMLTFLLDNKKTNYSKVVEIGGGFGNMCRLSNNIISYDSWDIIDLPHMLELQSYYLKNEIEDISKINFIDAHSNKKYENTEIDLVIGTHSVSEFSWDIFTNYFNNVISESKYFYYGYNKNCPNPQLINIKLNYILNNGFTVIKAFDYTEMPHGANVSYTLLINNKI